MFYIKHCESELFTSRNVGLSTLSPEPLTASYTTANVLYGPTSATSTASTCGAYRSRSPATTVRACTMSLVLIVSIHS
jgi:hypothetical protein